MKGRHILLIIGGGIAACKSLDLIRMIRKAGGSVTPVLTRAAEEFVTPLSVSALAGARAHTALFDLDDDAAMEHIRLSRDADLVVAAPATANLMARMAGGHADDLATTLLMATDKPVLIAPAMNVRMWEHPATRRNLAALTGDGIRTVGPNEGDMACGEYGPGRMAEPDEILAAIRDALERRPGSESDPESDPKKSAENNDAPLKGRRVLVTSGPTHEPIDPVRYIANRSSGAQGAALAAALRDLGAEVELISGPVTAALPEGVRLTRVETAAEMLAAVEARLPVEAAVFCAAVADWRVESASGSKIKKSGGKGAAAGKPPALKLTENPDILKTVSRLRGARRPALVIGFAAETENVVENAAAKRLRKGCDWIVANDVRPETGIMGGDGNAVTVITEAGAETWPEAPKTQVARKLALRIAAALTRARGGGRAA